MSGISLPVISKFDPTGIRKAEGAIKGFGSTVAKLGGIVAGAFSVAAVTNFTKQSVTAASDLEESLNAVTVSYGDASAAIIKLGDDAASRLGVTQTAFNQAAVRFSAFADRIVGAGGDTAGFIDDITQRASDFASVYNIEVAEALQVFQSGLAGEAEPLKRFGINLLQSEVQAYALRAGIIGVGETMTEQQKVQARYGLLLESTAKTQGDFANTSDGLANSQRILQATFTDMQATIGSALLPAFATLAQGLIPVVEQLGPVLTGVMENLAPVIANVAEQIPGLLIGFGPLLPILGDLVEFLFELIDAVLPMFVSLIEALFPVVEQLLPVFMELVENLLPALLPILISLIDAFLPLIEAVLPILTELLEFLIPIIEVVAELFAVGMVTAINFLLENFQNFMAFLQPFAAFFEETFGGIANFFYGIINNLIGMWEGFTNAVINGVNFVIRALNKIQVKIPDWVPELGGKKFGINIATLPNVTLPRVALAEGGIVTQPTTALIGERGPEAVIPLSQIDKLGSTYNINVTAGVGDPVTIGREVVSAIKRYERANGPVFASA